MITGKTIKGVAGGVAAGLGADLATGNGLDIASRMVGGAVSTARDVLSGLGLELPFTVALDVIGVVA